MGIWPFLVCLVLVLPPIVDGVEREAEARQVLIHLFSGKTLSVEVEVARTPQERSKGLMGRRALGKDKGMLFLFPVEQIHTFHMANTFIPLDMVFIDASKRIVGWVENAVPHSRERYRISAPSQYVLEVNAFFCREHGIVSGERVEFRNVE